MPQITLASHLVAYNLYTKLLAADSRTGRSCQGLSVQVPEAAVVAANAGAIVKIGRPDSVSSPTTISSAEAKLIESEEKTYPHSQGNNISLVDKWINASVDNCVVYVNTEYA